MKLIPSPKKIEIKDGFLKNKILNIAESHNFITFCKFLF